MTVKCLNKVVQDHICLMFVARPHSYRINELVRFYGTSRRTIIRVLEDHAIDPGIKERPAKPKELIPNCVESGLVVSQDDFQDFQDTQPFGVDPLDEHYQQLVTFRPEVKEFPEPPKGTWMSRLLDRVADRIFSDIKVVPWV